MCHVYVLRSETTGKRYVGVTADPERRLVEHNTGQTLSTRAGAPWRVIYNEPHTSRAAEMQRERFFKSGAGRRYLDEVEQRTAERPPQAEGRGFESRQPD